MLDGAAPCRRPLRGPLPTAHPYVSDFLSKFGEFTSDTKFRQILNRTFHNLAESEKNVQLFLKRKLEIRKRCKGVPCVDLGESFPTSVYLQILASIQPRNEARPRPVNLDCGVSRFSCLGPEENFRYHQFLMIHPVSQPASQPRTSLFNFFDFNPALVI